MSDWLVNQLAWFSAFMTAAGIKLQLWPLLVGPLAVLVHEAGHAIAALLLTADAVDLHVGDTGAGVAIRVGRLRARLRPWASGQAAGHVTFRPRALGRHATVIAAGPAASLAGALVGAPVEVGLAPASAAGQLVGASTDEFLARTGRGALPVLHGHRQDSAMRPTLTGPSVVVSMARYGRGPCPSCAPCASTAAPTSAPTPRSKPRRAPSPRCSPAAAFASSTAAAGSG